MTEPTTPDEDEAFNEIERISRVAQEIVRMTQDRETLFNINRNRIIEEVAQHIEKLTGFGQDTISSFAIYIRGMKK
jgi:hypothetical protein